MYSKEYNHIKESWGKFFSQALPILLGILSSFQPTHPCQGFYYTIP
jgi:hypothetical protein